MLEARPDAGQLLEAHQVGDPAAAERLLPLVYEKLRALAARYMKDERGNHTLQPTALVHEAYIKLIDISRIDWRGKTHFYAVAATQMRRVLVEHARATNARKRGGALTRIVLDDRVAVTESRTIELLHLDNTLSMLEARSARQGKVAELRMFAGLSFTEISQVLNISERTVYGDWRLARAWLSRELKS